MSVLKMDQKALQLIFRGDGTIETGMDYVEVNAMVSCRDRGFEEPLHLVVRSSGYAAPLTFVDGLEDVFTLDRKNMFALEKQHIRFEKSDEDAETEFQEYWDRSWRINTLSATLPQNYVAVPGSHCLIGRINLAKATRFYRYTSNPTDSRFSVNTLRADTYLTTENDQTFVNSGFGAVGRYALPMPVPASFRREYELPAFTSLMVGTVGPNYGQAGGGVEVKTTANVAGVIHINTVLMSDA
ncbi:MAG: hypothetical protein K2Y39_01540 [Candidatus Obscuribacterales bacterium]|nr:hypothetical protein [Candidatus Obscuribacterales bacterium]